MWELWEIERASACSKATYNLKLFACSSEQLKDLRRRSSRWVARSITQ